MQSANNSFVSNSRGNYNNLNEVSIFILFRTTRRAFKTSLSLLQSERRGSSNNYNESLDYSLRLPQIDQERSAGPKISLTGDTQIDADITAFINARKRIVNQMKRE